MQMNSPRMDLSIGYGPTRRRRLVLLSVYGVVLFVAACCLGTLVSLMATSLASSGGEPSGLQVLGGLALALLISVLPIVMIIKVTRLAAWLDGTRLTVRNLRTHSVELRTARSVQLTSVMERTTAGKGNSVIQSPVITVTGPDGSVTLPLRARHGALIPPHEMIALADALSLASCPGANEAAAWLRAMAADPRTLLT